jgi:hypothetical protein
LFPCSADVYITNVASSGRKTMRGNGIGFSTGTGGVNTPQPTIFAYGHNATTSYSGGGLYYYCTSGMPSFTATLYPWD